jgi:hypothetical protein
MKSCNGCKHLVNTSNASYCRADDGPFEWVVNPYTARGRFLSVDGRSPFRPHAEEMRAPGGLCGPEATLWEPNWWRHLFGA